MGREGWFFQGQVPSEAFHGWKLSSFTRGKRVARYEAHSLARFSWGGNIPLGDRRRKKKKRTTTMVETRIQREKGGEGSLNQAVKSFPAGKGEDKGQRK